MRVGARWSAPLAMVLAALGCVGASSESAEAIVPTAPFVVVLGSAQDGGLPQIGCRESLCEAARADPARRRFASSILLVDPRSGKRWLFDAGPELPEQVELARPFLDPTEPSPPGRPPLFDAIFLTHAHFGHYTGLAWLGREVYAANGQRVLGSPRMARFLTSTPPYELYARAGHLSVEALEPGTSLPLADELSVAALVVPHRDEYTDTLAFVVRGPRRALLYLPDIDKWDRWDRRLEDLLAVVDFALVDGTFFADGEVPGRSMAEIAHPFIVETLALLASLPAKERAKIHFVHLNHTNPASDPSSLEAATIRAAGMAVSREGERYEL